MYDSYTITGTLETDRLVRLDAPVSLPLRRVRITLEPLPPEQRNGKTLVEWVRKARADLESRGFRFRTKEEIDQQVREEREAWGD
jgi:hypothetical protein